jgi:hypothetical protein
MALWSVAASLDFEFLAFVGNIRNDPERSTSMSQWVKNVWAKESEKVNRGYWFRRLSPKKGLTMILRRQNISIEPSAKWTRARARVRELRTYECIVGRYVHRRTSKSWVLT